MRLLILTQTLDKNDGILGFMHEWVREFAHQCDEVTVIALGLGKYDLPPNVRVFSLGKESGRSRLKYLWNFFRTIICEHQHYDAVFVHMNPEYVVLGGIPWKMMGKKIALWYAHGHVSRLLRFAAEGADVIVTSTQSGFRLPSEKLHVIGQGIDTDFFAPAHKRNDDGVFRIVSVGRVSPVKDIATMLAAVDRLDVDPKTIEVVVVGGPGTDEQAPYAYALERKAKGMKYGDRTHFVGAVSNRGTLPYLHAANLFVNTSRTGSLDKAVLEAMACGVPILTCNEALCEILGDLRGRLMFPKGDAEALAAKMSAIMGLSFAEREELGKSLRGIVIRDHGLSGFVKKIVALVQ